MSIKLESMNAMVSKVEQIIVYPVKSLGGISVNKSKALTAGFEYDRRWMLLDENNVFITQREIPNLSQFSTSLTTDQLIITYQNETIAIPLENDTEDIFNAKVWDDLANLKHVNNAVNEWFSDHLKQRVKLVKMASENARSHFSSTKNMTLNVSLADGYPYLIVGDESLRNLNSNLEQPISINRFRPNIVVSTQQPHEEDNWDSLNIGQASFLNIKPCGRCQIVSIDPITSQINHAPLKSLNQIRKSGNQVLFGTNVMCTTEGEVSVGDTILGVNINSTVTF